MPRLIIDRLPRAEGVVLEVPSRSNPTLRGWAGEAFWGPAKTKRQRESLERTLVYLGERIQGEPPKMVKVSAKQRRGEAYLTVVNCTRDEVFGLRTIEAKFVGHGRLFYTGRSTP